MLSNFFFFFLNQAVIYEYVIKISNKKTQLFNLYQDLLHIIKFYLKITKF